MSGPDTAGSPEPAPTDDLAPAGRVGRYVIVGKLGQGGMGVVYSAYDDELDRAVAIKLLHPQRTSATARARLVREARALAKLSHPNVVAVHDAQTVGDAVYVAMELVEGADVRAWRAERERSLDEVLAVFEQAGRGLAAAHEAGIVHRDFKPANVLVGADGRVRVADFGLATGEAADDEDGAPPARERELDPWLTRSGDLVGTPAYMSPEQHRRKTVTAASDQFSFCVALAESLCGVRPFGTDELAAGELAPPELPGLAPRLRAALRRGLAQDPARRFPDMEALLAAIAPAPSQTKRLLAAGSVALALIAIGFVVARAAGGRKAGTPCAGAAEAIAGAWGPAQREEVRRSFVASGVPFAESSWARAAGGLDRYAARWTAAYVDACEDTRLRGEQPDQVLALRVACLDQRRQSLAATASVLASADARVVENAARLAAALPDLEGCANVATLSTRVPPPDDPAAQGIIDSARAELARAEPLMDAGRFAEARTVVDGVAAQARALQFAPLVAEVELLDGKLLIEEGDDGKLAEQAYYDAIVAAETGRHEEVVAAAWTDLIWVLGVRQRRPDEAERIARLADAALIKMGDPPLLRARYLSHLAGASAHGGRLDDMRALTEKALAIYDRVEPDGHPDALDLRFNLAVALQRDKHPAEALLAFQELLPAFEAVLGPDHPHTARCHYFVGVTLAALGRHDQAIDALSRALEIREAALGPDHRDVATTSSALAASLTRLGRFDEAARASARAAEIRVLLPSPPSAHAPAPQPR